MVKRLRETMIVFGLFGLRFVTKSRIIGYMESRPRIKIDVSAFMKSESEKAELLAAKKRYSEAGKPKLKLILRA